MLNVEIDRQTGVALVEPHGALSQDDFVTARAVIDDYLEAAGELTGLIINAQDFPGWDSFAALVEHFRFVRDHHRELARVALVTDSPLGGVLEATAGHFVAAEVKQFPYDRYRDAEAWILGGEPR